MEGPPKSSLKGGLTNTLLPNEIFKPLVTLLSLPFRGKRSANWRRRLETKFVVGFSHFFVIDSPHLKEQLYPKLFYMKKLFLIVIVLSVFSLGSHAQILKRLGDKAKQAIDKNPDNSNDPAKNKDTTGKKNNDDNPNNNQEVVSNTDPSAPPSLKVYANYDFVPGDTILFEDNFMDDQDGEFPSHWNLDNGQAVLNKFSGTECFYLTDGNYCVVVPLTKTKSYLGNNFTIEYDTYNPDNAAYGLMCFFKDASGSEVGNVHVTPEGAGCSYADGKSLFGSSPKEVQYENYKNKWHHIAIAYKNKQIKIYVDQYRVLVVPNSGIAPEYVSFGGIGAQDNPIIFKNVRIAEGGNMNMLGKKFTETKIVTHGINFDVNKATIKPESMGTLNMIVQVLKDNPEIKFEVGGHTDADGADDYNLRLSQQRADAVKDQLVKMGVDASRLTAKGYGESKPISDNATPEGKANNRRVEFVKL
jgi:outer membrane protein OmpA-like peptidoglycan-associated protein